MQDHRRAQDAQRHCRAAGAAGRDQGEARPLPAPGRTLAPGPRLLNLDDYNIVRTYGAGYRGVTGYYLLAGDVWRLHALRWSAETSMLKTLAAKHKSTVAKIAARYKAKIETPHGLRTCFEARVPRDGKKDLVARFGGIPLLRIKNGIIADPVPVPVPLPRKELISRLRKREVRAVRARHHGGCPPSRQARPSSASLDQASPRGQPSWRRNTAQAAAGRGDVRARRRRQADRPVAAGQHEVGVPVAARLAGRRRGGAGLQGTSRREPLQAGRGPARAAARAEGRPRPTSRWEMDQRWTLARVAALVMRLFGVSYTLRGVAFLLHRLGFSPQVPAHRAFERDEDAVAAWRSATWAKVRGSRR